MADNNKNITTPGKDKSAALSAEKKQDRAALKAETRAAAATRAAERREVKRLRREYERRRRLTPESHRPIICPPDRAGQDTKTVVLGYLCRALLIFFAVFGITLFVCDAFAFNSEETFGITAGYMALWSLIFTALFTVICTSKRGAIAGSLLLALTVFLRLLPSPVEKLINGVLATYNGALAHLADAGYFAMNEHAAQVSFAESEAAGYVSVGVMLFTLIAAAIYVPCVIKRIRILPPAIFSATLLWGVFMYNITRSNWGVVLVIASFSAMLVMFVYDRIYIKKPDPDEYDTAITVFGEETPPPLPETILEAQRAKQEKKEARAAAAKAAKAERRARRKGEKTITVEEELNEYFADPKKKKKAKKEKSPRRKLTPAEKKAAAAERAALRAAEKQKKKEEREALNRVRSFHDGIGNARYAMGGFAGAGMFALAMILLIIPAMATHENFTTIEAIDEKMDYYRDYVTAWLMGDDPVLDLLAYEGDQNNFLPRSTEAVPLHYYGTPMMKVEVNYAANVYLRGWIGVNYADGNWYTANSKSDEFTDYRRLFGTGIDPSEASMYAFYRLMDPDAIPDIDYTSKYKNNSDYGFITMQVNMKRLNMTSILLHMPSFSLRNLNPTITTSGGKNSVALRKFGSAEPTKLTYSNYFDGIYTSFRASRDTDGYGVVSMVTTMRDSGFYRDLAGLIADYNEIREVIGTSGVSEFLAARAEAGRAEHAYSIPLSDGTTLSYGVQYDTENGYTIISVPQTSGSAAGGTAVYTYDSDMKLVKKVMNNVPPVYDETGNVVERFYAAPNLPAIIRYLELMTDSQRAEVAYGYTVLDFYTLFVPTAYSDRADSEIISELYRKIVADARVEVRTVVETETTYDEIITYEPADFSRAAERSSTDSEVYEQRHKLVMEIINYLVDKDNFTYSLTPVQSTNTELDGIEKFLTETHEGYCVQFASALTLLLREAGIPARYVEGYVASDYNRNFDSEAAARYVATVRDWNAHAWVEVWYDGVGWVQYEATPVYYSDMYELSSSGGSSNVKPWYDEDVGEEEEEDPYVGLTDEEIAELIRQQEEAERRARIMRALTICAVVLAVAVLIILFFGVMTRRARKSQLERDRLLDLLAGCGKRNACQPERADVRRVADMLTLMLAECGAAPKRGEFRDEYAGRLAEAYRGVLRVAVKSEKMTEHESATTGMDTGAVEDMLDAIAAEEFGYGAPREAIPLLPRFYRRVYEGEYHRSVNVFRRMWLWLFRRTI